MQINLMLSEAREKYGDIIDHEHYVDLNRPQMSRLSRAAQFSPFAALSGYEDLIDESARLTSNQTELDESAKDEIARRIDVLLHMDNPPQAEITYFLQDERKRGGKYETVQGTIIKYDGLARSIDLDNGTTLFIDDITSVSAKCFED